MKKIRAAIVGYGNIGKYTLQALLAAPDFEVAGVVRRSGAENLPAELEGYNVVKDIRELGDVDVAILSTPTRSVEKYAKDILALGTEAKLSKYLDIALRDEFLTQEELDAAEEAAKQSKKNQKQNKK